jgi:peptidoglycan/LPS O-acetylase OafA/YrhL
MNNHKQALGYIPQLDGIRGIAILLVIAYHSMLWQLKTGVVPKYVHIALQATKTGWLGVDLFFVLSGFLITRILLNTKNEPWYFRSFYARRALRILPVFWVTIIAVALFYDAPGSYVACCFLFLANIGPLFGVTSMYLPFWSLCVEEHYYLLWPCIVKLMRREVLPWICAAVCIGEPLLRILGLRWGADIVFVSWYRFDGLAYGSLLALLSQN